MMMGMSPRLASINSGAEVGIVPNNNHHSSSRDDPMMNSSQKDTMKMNVGGRRGEFSFIESVNREFGIANIGQGIY